MRTHSIFPQRICIYTSQQSGRHAATCRHLPRPIDSISDCYQPDGDTLPVQAEISAEVNGSQLTASFLLLLSSIFHGFFI